MNKTSNDKRFSWKRMLREAVIFLLIIIAISWFQGRHLLSSDDGPAPPLKGHTLAGALLGLEDLRSKPTLAYFFAPWCGVCKYSIGNLDWIDGFLDAHVVAIALDYQSTDEVQKFALDHGVTVPVILGTEKIRESFRVQAYPTYYVINSQGQITFSSVGYATWAGMFFRLLLTE